MQNVVASLDILTYHVKWYLKEHDNIYFLQCNAHWNTSRCKEPQNACTGSLQYNHFWDVTKFCCRCRGFLVWKSNCPSSRNEFYVTEFVRKKEKSQVSRDVVFCLIIKRQILTNIKKYFTHLFSRACQAYFMPRPLRHWQTFRPRGLKTVTTAPLPPRHSVDLGTPFQEKPVYIWCENPSFGIYLKAENQQFDQWKKSGCWADSLRHQYSYKRQVAGAPVTSLLRICACAEAMADWFVLKIHKQERFSQKLSNEGSV